MAGSDPGDAEDVFGQPDAAGAGELSPTMRDYLAEVYRLSERGALDSYISTSALAENLEVSAPAVNRMVTRLRELNCLQHEPYQGIRLTPEGTREALRQLRRQRIVEAFLVTVMGFGWHQVHDEAIRIARSLTEPVAERMLQMAGSPPACPHGEPIPSIDGTIVDLHDLALPDAPQNQMLTVTRVSTREADRLEYVAVLGLLPGRTVEVLHAAPFHGPIQLRVGKEYRIIGHNLAEMIRAVDSEG
ncbi:MAG TPA: metal-dependent transcriptional regulator [Candidatus Limnocylindrales bacterium]|nr:metal-dependent transcriptional regulator [Candidatus Limnocylindrales bacterium]